MGKGVISYYPNTESKPNPIVARQRNPWPLVVLVVAFVAVLYLLDGIWGARQPIVIVAPTGVAQAQPMLPTLAVQVEAVLHVPTNTPYPTPLPTSTPGATVTVNDCGSPEPNTVCAVPYPPPPTQTPYPSCERMEVLPPGSWCKWYVASPVS